MYDNIEYAAGRLEQTVVKHNDKPVRVNRCFITKGNIFAEVFALNNDQEGYKVPLKELDLTPVKLGFVNTNIGIGYLGRIPLRRDWKQGLRNNNMRVMWGGIDPRWINDVDLHNTIVGNYPTFHNCLEEVVNTTFPKAFHRNFALMFNKGEVLLAYKYLGAVGDIVNNKPQLFEKFNYLNEVLDQVMGGVNA